MKVLLAAASAFVATSLATAPADDSLRKRVADVWAGDNSKAIPRAAAVEAASATYEDAEDEDFEYVAQVDPVRRALALAANTTKEARRLGGVYGLCGDGVNIPASSALICDPPDALPQICTLACKKGYWSSGTHKDLACADAMCEGPCKSRKYECKGNEIRYGTRECDVTRYTSCSGDGAPESGMCLETVKDTCSYSFYEETSRPCCEFTQQFAPEGCWNSGCSGNCDSPGVFHYYSEKCSESCPPWRDPDFPNFNCSPCTPPAASALKPGVKILTSDAEGNDPPTTITIGCDKGYWGNSVVSYCMSYDGTFYPPGTDVVCNKCSAPPTLEGELFTRVVVEASATDGTIGKVEFRCISGFVGESTFSTCNPRTGSWNYAYPPYCEVAPTPSISPTASVTPSPSSDPALFTASPTPSETATETPSVTPSVSKSPRPPKIKGSRAPTQAPKLRVSAVPSSSASPVV